MISAKEAQRLTKTRWQAELTKLEKLVKRAIGNNLYSIEYTGKLLPDTIDYLKDLGYVVTVTTNKVVINWAEKEM